MEEASDAVLSVVPNICIYGKDNCRFCDEAKKAFDSVELQYDVKHLHETLCMPDDAGITRSLNDQWRTNGMIELQAMWVMCGEPVPFIVIDGKGCRNLAAALDAVNYRVRKRLILARKKTCQG